MKLKFLPLLAAIICILAACGPIPIDPLPATVALAIPTPTPTPLAYEQCGWQWATQPLPQLSDALQTALRENGLPEASAYAEAYGENCIDGTGKVNRFAALQTDFHVTLDAQNLNDAQELGKLLEQALAVLARFPPDQTPGPQPGYIGITYTNGSEAFRLWFNQTRLNELRVKGLSGADLFNVLKTP